MVESRNQNGVLRKRSLPWYFYVFFIFPSLTTAAIRVCYCLKVVICSQMSKLSATFGPGSPGHKLDRYLLSLLPAGLLCCVFSAAQRGIVWLLATLKMLANACKRHSSFFNPKIKVNKLPFGGNVKFPSPGVGRIVVVKFPGTGTHSAIKFPYCPALPPLVENIDRCITCLYILLSHLLNLLQANHT